jgi:hypothetical protein
MEEFLAMLAVQIVMLLAEAVVAFLTQNRRPATT